MRAENDPLGGRRSDSCCHGRISRIPEGVDPLGRDYARATASAAECGVVCVAGGPRLARGIVSGYGIDSAREGGESGLAAGLDAVEWGWAADESVVPVRAYGQAADLCGAHAVGVGVELPRFCSHLSLRQRPLSECPG